MTNKRRGGTGLAALARDKRGGIAVMSALAMMPLSMLALAGVEFYHFTNVRGDLQDSLDAATLAVARSSDTDPAKLQNTGMTVLRAGLEASSTGYVIRSATFVDADGDVTGQAALAVTPIVSELFKVTELSASAYSKASRLGQKLEIALVLDNTYSMLTNNRLGISKTAATSFVDKLNDAAVKSRVPDALKISVVPYSTTVNVGSQYAAATWMDTSAQNPIHSEIFSTPANRFTLFTQMGVAWGGCVESRAAPYDVQETPPTTADAKSLIVPYFAPDEADEWTYRLTNNYLADGLPGTTWDVRQKSAAKYVTPPAASTWNDSGYGAGPNYGCTLQPLVRLTTDMAKVKSGINAMTATGDTYTNLGLMWGWHTLSPLAPFSDGAGYDKPIRKIAVLMTDGENAAYNNGSPNASIYSGGAYIPQGRFGISAGTALERRAALDARMSLVCANMKARGIILYTIRVEVTGGTGNVLRDCASDPSKFFDVTAASQLNATFDAIAKSLLNLRISS